MGVLQDVGDLLRGHAAAASGMEIDWRCRRTDTLKVVPGQVYITVHYIHYTTLHYTTLHYTTLHYTTLHYTTLHYTTLHYTTLHYTTLHYTVYHCTWSSQI